MDVTVECEVPAAVAWAVLARTEHWTSWGPSITAVEPTSGEVEPGLVGRVRTPVGLWVPFEVGAVEIGRSWSWRVAGVSATGHRVEALGPERCRVVIEVPWWAPAYVPVCRLALGRLRRRALQLAAGPPDVEGDDASV